MKKYFVIAILVFMGTTNAQVTYKPGIKAGLNLSRFTNTDATTKTDFYIGGLFAIKFTKRYTLQPELIYSRQGANMKLDLSSLNPIDPNDPIFIQTSKVKYSLDYLALGIINKFTFGKGFQVVVGPSIDFKIDDNFSENYARNPIGFDLALVAGLGYSFNNLTVEARLKQGLVDIFGNYDQSNDTNGNGNYDEIVLNQLFQFGVAYTFNFKK